MRRFQEWRCALRTLAVAVVLVAFINRPVPAATSNWTTDTGGDFSNSANWDNGVPGAADTAIFRRGNADYTVTFTGDVATDKLRVGTNTITFRPSSNGGTYSVGNPFLPAINTAEIVIGEIAADTAVELRLFSTFRRPVGCQFPRLRCEPPGPRTSAHCRCTSACHQSQNTICITWLVPTNNPPISRRRPSPHPASGRL